MGVIEAGLKYNVVTLVSGIAALIYISVTLQSMACTASISALEGLDQQQLLVLGGGVFAIALGVSAGIGKLVFGWGRDGLLGWITVPIGVALAGWPVDMVFRLVEPVFQEQLLSASIDAEQLTNDILALDLAGVMGSEAFPIILGSFLLNIAISTVIAGAVIQYIWKWE